MLTGEGLLPPLKSGMKQRLLCFCCSIQQSKKEKERAYRLKGRVGVDGTMVDGR